MNRSIGKLTYDYAGCDVLVVGASRGGIGAAIARAFKVAGATVTITGVEDLPAEVDQGQFVYVKLDVTDSTEIITLASQTKKCDIVINCAAITARGEEMAPDFFEHVVKINLHGTFRIAEAFHDHLARAKGCLINIASMYAFFGSPQNPAYGASKAAVAQLTRSLAIAWADDGIRVNAVAPGFIITEQSARSRCNPEHIAKVTDRTPAGRWGEPEDIAGPVLFLASDEARFMTGTCMAIDGGYSVV